MGIVSCKSERRGLFQENYFQLCQSTSGTDLWGDDAAFCQITLTSCYTECHSLKVIKCLVTCSYSLYTVDNLRVISDIVSLLFLLHFVCTCVFVCVPSAVVMLVSSLLVSADLEHIVSKNQSSFCSNNVHAGWVSYIWLIVHTQHENDAGDCSWKWLATSHIWLERCC